MKTILIIIDGEKYSGILAHEDDEAFYVVANISDMYVLSKSRQYTTYIPHPFVTMFFPTAWDIAKRWKRDLLEQERQLEEQEEYTNKVIKALNEKYGEKFTYDPFHMVFRSRNRVLEQ